MMARIFVNGIYISIVFMLQHFTNFLGAAPQQEATVLFTMFVVFQLFNAFNCRELDRTPVYKNLLNNKLMLGVFLLVLILQMIITQAGGAVFETVPLSVGLWCKILAVSCSVVVLDEIWKLLGNKKECALAHIHLFFLSFSVGKRGGFLVYPVYLYRPFHKLSM